MLAKIGWVVVGVGLDDDGRWDRRVDGYGGAGCCWAVDGVDIGGCEWEQERLNMAKNEKLSMEEEGEIVRGLGKSLPLKDACAYAGVVWERVEGLMGGDEELKMRLGKVVAQEQGRILELMKAKSGDVKALAFLLERIYGLSTVEVKEVKKEKGGVVGLTITPAVLKALAGGSEKVLKRN